MNPVEVLTSESQERMLAIVTPANLDAVLRARGALGDARDRGRARHRAEPRFRVFDGLFDAIGVPGENPAPPRRRRRAARQQSDREPIADVPVGSLGDGPSTAARSRARPRRTSCRPTIPRRSCAAKFGPGADLGRELLALLATPTIADKTWVSRQYDHQLFLNTVAGPGARRRGAAREGHREGARARHRRQGPLLPARSAHGRPARRARSRAQRRVRRARVRSRS